VGLWEINYFVRG